MLLLPVLQGEAVLDEGRALLGASGALHPRLQSLLDEGSPLGALLSEHGAVVQAGGRLALVQGGRVRLEAVASEVLPVVDAIAPPCVYLAVPGAAPQPGTEAGGKVEAPRQMVEVRGRRLGAADCLVLCRQRGQHLTVEVHASGMDWRDPAAAALARGEDRAEWVEVWPLGLLPGTRCCGAGVEGAARAHVDG